MNLCCGTSLLSNIGDLVFAFIFDSELLHVGDFACWELSHY